MKHLSMVSAYYIRTFGGRVLRLSVGTGGSCPNRDSENKGGCLYCDIRGSAADDLAMEEPLERQIEAGIRPGKRYILYFQPFTATFGAADALKDSVEKGLRHPQVIGISIGTRPDCLDEETWDWLSGLHRRTHLELELGLQTASDSTLEFLNRGHTAQDFRAAAERAGRLGLRVVAHIVLGLPGEGDGQVRDTALFLNGLPIHGVKMHPLHIMRSSSLAALYQVVRMTDGGEVFHAPGAPDMEVLTLKRYAGFIARFLTHLNESVIVYRLTGGRQGPDFLGPRWLSQRASNIQYIRKFLKEKDIVLGTSQDGA